ncbi:hypothetical protein LZ30DRAFT_409537 [Colletotrichum cereale]|nr:hypothetical protein LZ30DRAFT_409537 [Colletotrichum cereale]
MKTGVHQSPTKGEGKRMKTANSNDDDDGLDRRTTASGKGNGSGTRGGASFLIYPPRSWLSSSLVLPSFSNASFDGAVRELWTVGCRLWVVDQTTELDSGKGALTDDGMVGWDGEGNGHAGWMWIGWAHGMEREEGMGMGMGITSLLREEETRGGRSNSRPRCQRYLIPVALSGTLLEHAYWTLQAHPNECTSEDRER